MAPTSGAVFLHATLAILIPDGVVQGRHGTDDASRDPGGGAHLAIGGDDAQEHDASLSLAPQCIVGYLAEADLAYCRETGPNLALDLRQFGPTA